MTWAVDRPNHRHWGRHSTAESRAGLRVEVRPVGAAEVGLLAALVGAWGALSVFVGPTFGYQPTSADAWSWTTQNWLLHLVPGAAAVVAGLMILSASPGRHRRAGHGAPIGLAALILVCAGAWFVIGPALWATFESGQPYATGTDAWTSFVNQVGSSLGPGILLAMLGGMAFKAVIARPAAAVHDAMDDGTAVDDGAAVSNVGPAENGRRVENEMPAERVAPVDSGGRLENAVPGERVAGAENEVPARDRVADPENPTMSTPADRDAASVAGEHDREEPAVGRETA